MFVPLCYVFCCIFLYNKVWHSTLIFEGIFFAHLSFTFLECHIWYKKWLNPIFCHLLTFWICLFKYCCTCEMVSSQLKNILGFDLLIQGLYFTQVFALLNSCLGFFWFGLKYFIIPHNGCGLFCCMFWSLLWSLDRA